jgi:hypothetical protein
LDDAHGILSHSCRNTTGGLGRWEYEEAYRKKHEASRRWDASYGPLRPYGPFPWCYYSEPSTYTRERGRAALRAALCYFVPFLRLSPSDYSSRPSPYGGIVAGAGAPGGKKPLNQPNQPTIPLTVSDEGDCATRPPRVNGSGIICAT